MGEVHMIRQGLCPYREEPLPYSSHLKAECVSNHAQETCTVVKYCVVQEAMVTRDHSGCVTCNRADLVKCSYQDGFCMTKNGGVVTWTPDRDVVTTKKVWEGVVDLYDNVIVIPELQEAYNLVGDVILGRMNTKEVTNNQT